MKSLTLTLAAASFLALSACNPKPKTVVIDTNPDPMANQLANAAPVELPPAISSDAAYRCSDNSLVYVTLFNNNKQAVVRTQKDGPATKLTAPTAGEPMTADGGWKLTGDAQKVTLTQPGKSALTCHV